MRLWLGKVRVKDINLPASHKFPILCDVIYMPKWQPHT
ncbi:hypothetical protein yfred0001_33740 [Yersinia frederiksenii ATCC 33641]|nr:hypothetical protein yfred0001_33740 [Yersinia frederiksenii ATCC 33641]